MPGQDSGGGVAESEQSGRIDHGPVLNGALSKILGQLVMPFARLGCYGAMSGGPFLRGPAHIETLV